MNFVLILGILLILGLASTRIMRLVKLPNVTGFLIVGLIVAVCCVLLDGWLNLNLSTELSNLNEGVSSVALGFIALSILHSAMQADILSRIPLTSHSAFLLYLFVFSLLGFTVVIIAI